jgi:hypothetical protein
MRRIGITFVVVLVSTLLLSWNPAHRVLARAPQRASHQDLPPIIRGGTPIVIVMPNLPQLTATAVPPGANRKPAKPAAPPDAVRVALTDTFVRALLKGKAYRVQKVAPWLPGKGTLVLTGFYHSATVSGTWLAIGKPPYHATYRKVAGLQIYVASARHTVVAIVPQMQSK